MCCELTIAQAPVRSLVHFASVLIWVLLFLCCCIELRGVRVALKEGEATMVQPKQGLSLLKFIPKAMRPQTSDVSSVVLWGTTAACGALWLVQPFDWIKEQISGGPKEEEQK